MKRYRVLDTSDSFFTVGDIVTEVTAPNEFVSERDYEVITAMIEDHKAETGEVDVFVIDERGLPQITSIDYLEPIEGE